MKDIIERIFDRVFSFTTWVVFMVALFVYSITLAIINTKEASALDKAATGVCYNNGMIKVETIAGPYCVAPANLVKVK